MAIVLVLNGTVFVVRDINVVNYRTGQALFENHLTATSISVNTKLELGMNIFTVSESTVRYNVEVALPYAKVINIERKFPNKVELVVLERYALYAVKQENNFVYIDREGIVLDMQAHADNIVEVEGLELVDVALSAKATDTDRLCAKLPTIAAAFEACGYYDEKMSSIIDRIVFNNSTAEFYTHAGVVMRFNVNMNVDKKLYELLSWYVSDDGLVKRYTGTVTIYDDNEKPIYSAD